ncbi:MAG: phosphatidylcholine/phosphatidylserine synthase [Sedimentisphaerales bacterium]|nr:phosphatidylcholine/phosphatidylserine synthase [Sedimentisphaerales bacterium]
MTRRKKRRGPAEQLKRVAVLPALATLMNAVCGFAAIHFAARGMNDPKALWLAKPSLTYFAAAAYMIFLAMIADALDGQVARLSGSTTGFGAQLDSMADMVSFGVAPAFLMLRVVESSLHDILGPVGPAFGGAGGKLLWLIAVAYVCCAAMRLARFNIESNADISSHMGFSGLPSPAAAGLIASLVLLCRDLLPELQEDVPREWVVATSEAIVYLLPVATAATALLMVSRIPYPHAINHLIRGKRPFHYVARLVLIALFLVWKPQLTLAIGFLWFACSGVVGWLWRRRRGGAEITQTPPAEPQEEAMK